MICLFGLVTQDLPNGIHHVATLAPLLQELRVENKLKTDMEMYWDTNPAGTKEKVMLVGLSAQQLIEVKNLVLICMMP